MEFLDIKLTETQVFCSKKFKVSSTGGFDKKHILYSGFKIHTKFRRTRKLLSIQEFNFVDWKNEDR